MHRFTKGRTPALRKILLKPPRAAPVPYMRYSARCGRTALPRGAAPSILHGGALARRARAAARPAPGTDVLAVVFALRLQTA